MSGEKYSSLSPGDGGDFEVTPEVLSGLQQDARLVAGDQSYDRMWRARVESRQTRLCQWSGQSPDNRKWAKNAGNEEVEPFEGACDIRQRYADMVGNEKMMLCILSMIRGAVRVTPAEGSDVAFAGNLELVRRYLIRNAIGWEWFREFIKLGSQVFGETPGVGKMRVTWVRRIALKYETIDLDGLTKLWIETQEVDEQDQAALQEEAVRFQEAFMNPEQEEGALADLIQEFFPFVNRGRAKKVVRELRTTGVARFPAPHVAYEGPEIRAQSYLSEWVVSTGCGEFQRCDRYYEYECLTESEVRSRRVTDGWSEAFVDELLQTESDSKRGMYAGKILFQEYGMGDNGSILPFESSRYRGLYQVVHAYVKYTNEDNIPGRYAVTFHPDVKVAATEMRLIDYAHNKWPGHVFQREVLSDKLLDSRGIPELASGVQGMLKLHTDNLGDHGQISALPMMRAPRKWEGDDVEVGPLAVLENRGPQGGEWSWLQPPQFPTSVGDMIGRIQSMGDEYFGRPSETVHSDVKRLHDEFTVFWWLTNVSEVIRQILQLAQQYMSDEMLARVTNREGETFIRDRTEIQGQFDVAINFDPRMLDPDFLEKAGGFVQGILLAIDRENTIDTAPLVENLMWQFWPEMADRSIRDVQQATQAETDKERTNWQMILAGEEPPMVDDGSENYGVRRQYYDQLEEMNPEIYNSLPEDRRTLLQARVEHLDAMQEQYGANAQIGRQGAVSGSQRLQEKQGSNQES